MKSAEYQKELEKSDAKAIEDEQKEKKNAERTRDVTMAAGSLLTGAAMGASALKAFGVIGAGIGGTGTAIIGATIGVVAFGACNIYETHQSMKKSQKIMDDNKTLLDQLATDEKGGHWNALFKDAFESNRKISQKSKAIFTKFRKLFKDYNDKIVELN